MNHENYILTALELARQGYEMGEVPVGALIVSPDGEVIARAHNQTEKRNAVTKHAELLAIEQAGTALSNWRLLDCTLYVTLEPCIMCAYAIKLSRLKRVVYGAPDKRMGGLGTVIDLSTEEHLGSQLEVISGINENECSKLLKDFFRMRRDEG